MLDPQKIISLLDLERHEEGGYFRQTYRSKDSFLTKYGDSRPTMTSIYYLLSEESHLSYFAVNRSDLVLYHHFGDPVKIIFLTPDGDIEEKILGSDLEAGHWPQLICPGGIWKAYDLMEGKLALIGEAVSPGFDYQDMRMPTFEELQKAHPLLTKNLRQYFFNGNPNAS